MKFKITIEEMVSQDFFVDAKDIGSALEIAEKNYGNGEFVLEPGNLVRKQICGESLENCDCVDWYEF